ncbi:hypothetical protein QTP86_001298 [Hemibagrus guttatus]|nr:hypothetical protein QTP86_001298 [Hemibagrus guttatus]
MPTNFTVVPVDNGRNSPQENSNDDNILREEDEDVAAVTWLRQRRKCPDPYAEPAVGKTQNRKSGTGSKSATGNPQTEQYNPIGIIQRGNQKPVQSP